MNNHQVMIFIKPLTAKYQAVLLTITDNSIQKCLQIKAALLLNASKLKLEDLKVEL